MKTIKKLIKAVYGFFCGFTLRKYIATAVISGILLALCAWLLGNDTLINIVGVMLGIILTSLLLNILRAILTNIEDDVKVSDNDKDLLNFYDKKSYCKYLLFDDKSAISFLYDKTYQHLKDNEILIDDEPQKEFQLNSLLENNFFELMKAHTRSYFNNCPTVRLDRFTLENKTLTLFTSRSTFINHLVTNRAIDYKINNLLTLRQIFEGGPTLSPLEKSIFSNHIGINALVFLNDGSLIVPHRSNNSTISKNMITSSVATRLELDDYSKQLKVEMLMFDSIRNYLKDLSLPPTAIKNARIQFSGFGRNLYEGGKPQFYFLVNVDIGKEEYAKILLDSDKTKNKKIDRNKKIYICDTASFCSRKNYLGFKFFVSGNKYKKRFFAPEKSMLCNIWHLSSEMEKPEFRIFDLKARTGY